jgi:hypothetical protein
MDWFCKVCSKYLSEIFIDSSALGFLSILILLEVCLWKIILAALAIVAFPLLKYDENLKPLSQSSQG